MMSQGRLERLRDLEERKVAMENELVIVNRQLEYLRQEAQHIAYVDKQGQITIIAEDENKS